MKIVRQCLSPAASLVLALLSAFALEAQGQSAASLTPSSDFSYLAASFAERDPPTWTVNGIRVDGFQPPELFYLSGKGALVSADGLAPAQNQDVVFEAGHWGRAFRLAGGGALAYPRAGILDVAEGTLEFWISPREDGDRPSMAAPTSLVGYKSPSGDFLMVQVSDGGVLHGGAMVSGAWESAYVESASVRGWKAGNWHHVLFAWSAASSTMRFYVDGLPMGDTNEHHYIPPDAKGAFFLVGSPLYFMEGLRIWNRPLDASLAMLNATRRSPPLPRESLLPMTALKPGDSVACASGGRVATFQFRGLPLTLLEPQGGLLPAGSTKVALSLGSLDPTICRYSVGADAAWADMALTEGGPPSLTHRLEIEGLSSDPAVTNEVYVRCGSFPGFSVRLRLRSLTKPPEGFPRLANLWYDKPLDRNLPADISRLGLFVPSDNHPSRETLRRLHRENPSLLIFATVQPFEYFEGEPPIPEAWYLKDTRGRRVSMWPSSSRLNMTLPEVVEFNAQRIRKTLIDSDYLFDGAFFDSFGAEPGMERDCYGRSLEIDADNDGKRDDPGALAKAWRKGVLGVVKRFKELEPNALMTGHLGEEALPEYGKYFHGDNIAFVGIDVIEGKRPFSYFKDRYDGWFADGRRPGVSVIDVGAPNQLGYGYGVYADWDKARSGIPAGVLDFARTWYPSMRFGLTVALMNDGYFERHFSDVLYCVDWWYDEYGADLGKALGPARLALDAGGTRELVAGGDMEAPGLAPWSLWSNTAEGASAVMAAVETSPKGKGGKALRVDIKATGSGDSYFINLYEDRIRVVAGASYELSFRAKAEAARTMDVSLQRRAGAWEGLGFWRRLDLETEWREYRFRFEASGSRDDAGLQFFLAGGADAVWLDDVSLKEAPPEVWRRDFERGLALVNGSSTARKVDLPDGYSRLEGAQAPRWQLIIDEDAKETSFSGAWKVSSYDTTAWKVDGPFYHNWGKTCRESSDPMAVAEWKLAIPEDGIYSIKAWWTAAPPQRGWASAATYEVLVRGKVASTAVLNQSRGGDAWTELANLRLARDDRPTLRLRNGGRGILYADAILLESAARYNDGSPAREVMLAPFDGIVLRKDAR